MKPDWRMIRHDFATVGIVTMTVLGIGLLAVGAEHDSWFDLMGHILFAVIGLWWSIVRICRDTVRALIAESARKVADEMRQQDGDTG